jgi:hypothetical protein
LPLAGNCAELTGYGGGYCVAAEFSPSPMKSVMAVAVALIAGGLLSIHAEPPDVMSGGKSPGSVETDWDAFQSSIQADLAGAAPGRQIGTLVAAADRLHTFFAANPGDLHARDARCLEAIMLWRAALAGDSENDGRRASVFAQARRDTKVTPRLRAELLATADSVAIARQSALTREQRLQAYAESARGVIAEFADLPNGYETLLRVAHDSTDKVGTALAQEVAGMAAAPQWVRLAAQVLVARFGLVGHALAGPAHDAGVPDALVASDRPIIVYSWSSSDSAGLARIRAVAAKASNTKLIGVPLDDTSVAGRELPGVQVDAVVAAGFARALLLTESGLIYGADAAGVIRSVTLKNDLGAAFLGLGN